MDDDPRYSSSRYLRVPFIFVPDGAPEPPQLAAFRAAHPGAVKFHAKLKMSPVGAGATVANKPIIVSHAKKRELRPAQADVRAVRRYNPDVPSHARAAAAEAELAQKVHDMPDEHVLYWGQPIGSHGPDVVSVNTRTGAVTLWDAKSRSRRVTMGQSSTFTEKDPRANAIADAAEAIQEDKTLAPNIRAKALDNLEAGRVRTVTTGFGNVRNSVIGD